MKPLCYSAEGQRTFLIDHQILIHFSWLRDSLYENTFRCPSLLMTMSGEVTDGTTLKVYAIGSEPKDGLKRVSLQIKIVSQAAVFRVWVELECDGSGTLQNVVTC